MAKGFVVNAAPLRPVQELQVSLMWDGRVVLGVSKVSALKRTTEVVKHREGGDNSTDRKSPGRTSYEAITLERGITHDPEFEKWANMVHPLERRRGDGPGELPQGHRARWSTTSAARPCKRYKLFRCWVSEYTGRCPISTPTPTRWPSRR